jgi:hypothetical protein
MCHVRPLGGMIFRLMTPHLRVWQRRDKLSEEDVEMFGTSMLGSFGCRICNMREMLVMTILNDV